MYENHSERRIAQRFPMELRVRYTVMHGMERGETGVGKTVNISSAGVLFETDCHLVPDHAVEIAINWPARLNNNCALRLIARGRVIRSAQGKAVLRIHKSEFRTTGVK